MKISRIISLAAMGLLSSSVAFTQVTLSGTSYTQDFNSILDGLPTGWTVTTSASLTSLGTAATFSSAKETWASATNAFRNLASNSIAFGSDATQQSNSTDRALGWRPVGANSTVVTPYRTGALTLEIANTTNLSNFSVSLDVFQLFNTSGIQTYVFEYRVGNTGSFTQIGSIYTTKDAAANYTDFNSTTFTANSVTLSSLNNQSQSVFFRLRGTGTVGSTNLDTIGIDNFVLTYTAVPEPSTYAAILGGVALVGVMVVRRRKSAANAA